MYAKLALLLSKISFVLRPNFRVKINMNPEGETTNEMTGFFATLTEEQKEKALAYRGDENHGDLLYKIGR